MIVGLDIISMFFVYKTILETTETGSVLRDKLMGMLEGLADTSMYTATPDVNIDPEVLAAPSVASAATGILKNTNNTTNNVRIDETKNTVFTIDTSNPPSSQTSAPPVPTTLNKTLQQQPELNYELAKLAEDFQTTAPVLTNSSIKTPPPPAIDTKPVKPASSAFPAPLETRKHKSAQGGSAPSVNVDAEYSQRMKEYGSQPTLPSSQSATPIASTSISDIQKLRAAANNTTDVLLNRDQLTNEDIEKIKLNYDPNDVLKLYGFGEPSNLQQQSNRGGLDTDDVQSSVSGVSDIGSAFDIDLSEFENSL